MSPLLIIVVVGAVSLSQTPIFSRAYLESIVMTQFYRTELYLDENGFANILAPKRTKALVETGFASSVPVLMYHGITKDPEDTTISDLTIAQFKEHMLALKAAGYTTVSLADFQAFIRGEKQLPKRSVVITFDDGRRDSFYHAGPLLTALEYTAVMYMIGIFTEEVTSAVGNYYLSKRETAHLAKSDTWEIGSHSYNGHRQIAQDSEGARTTPFLGGRMWVPEKNDLESIDEFKERVRDDLFRSQKVLQEITDEDIKTLAFPFGNYGEATSAYHGDVETRDAVIEEARKYYDLLFYQSSPQQYFTQTYVATNGNSRDHTMVRRVTVSNEMSGSDLLRMLESGLAKQLPFTASFATHEGWVNAWGTTIINNGALTLDARGLAAGAASILDGTRHWLDYRVEADVTTENGSSVVLMARHDSEGNTAACNYGKTFVHINQTIDGEERVIRGADKLSIISPEGETRLTVAAEVVGRTLRCYLDDVLMVETEFLDPLLSQGGTGIKTWNPIANAELTVHSFKALSISTEP